MTVIDRNTFYVIRANVPSEDRGIQKTMNRLEKILDLQFEIRLVFNISLGMKIHIFMH